MLEVAIGRVAAAVLVGQVGPAELGEVLLVLLLGVPPLLLLDRRAVLPERPLEGRLRRRRRGSAAAAAATATALGRH
eukprot:1085225-Prymnesium_polylepis.1